MYMSFRISMYTLFIVLAMVSKLLEFVLSQMTSRNPRTQHLHSWHLI